MPQDELILSETDRAKLDGIVQQMIANNESEENIQFVVDDFKTKYAVKKKESTTSTSSDGTSQSPTTGKPQFSFTTLPTQGPGANPYMESEQEVFSDPVSKTETKKPAGVEKPYVSKKPKDIVGVVTQEQALSDNTSVKPTPEPIKVEGFDVVTSEDGVKTAVPKRVVPPATQQSVPAEQEEYVKGEEVPFTSPKTFLYSAAQGLTNSVADIAKGMGIPFYEPATYKTEDGEELPIPGLKKPEGILAYKIGQNIQQFGQDTFPVDPNDQQELLAQIGQGLGSMIPYFLGGLASKAFTVPEWIVPATMGSFQNGTAQYEDAVRNGADPTTAMQSYWGGFGFGSLEGVPIATWMNRIDGFTGGLLNSNFLKRLEQGIGPSNMAGVEEILQESFTQWGNNLTAEALYDETRSMWDGLGETAITAGILGKFTTAMTLNLTERLQDPTLTPSERLKTQKTLEFIQEKEAKLEGKGSNDLVKLDDDSQAITELKHTKAQLESDMGDPKIDDTVKEQIAAKIEETDAQIQQTKEEELQAESALVQTEGAIADLEAEKSELESQMSTATTATQEILQPQLEAIVSDLESLKAMVPQEETTQTEIADVKEEANDQGRTEVLTGQQEDMGVAEDVTPVVEPTPDNVLSIIEEGGNARLDELMMTESLKAQTAEVMAPKAAERLVEIENEMLNQGIYVRDDYDYETQVLDAKTGEAIEIEDLTPEQLQMVQTYEKATQVMGEYVRDFNRLKSEARDNLLGKPLKEITNETNTTDGKKTAKRSTPKGVQEPVQQTPAKKKITRKGTPIHKRKIKGKRLQAVNIEPQTLKEEIMQRIIGGARVLREDIVKMLGSETEAKVKMNLTAKKENGGKTIDRLAEEITAEQYNRDADGNGRYSEDEVKAELMEVLRMYDHYSTMADEIVDSRERSAEMEAEMLTMDAEEDLIASLGKDVDTEVADAAIDLLEMFSDEVLAQMANDKDMAFSPEIEEEITDIESDWTPWDEVTEGDKPVKTEEGKSKQGFTEGEKLNTIFNGLKKKYGDKKGSNIYDAAIRLVNPNTNEIIEVRGNGVVVKEGDRYLLKPFGNTDANSKKWTLYKPLDITEQFSETPSTSDKIISALEKAKIDTKNTLNAFGLLPATYNAAIDIVIAAIKAGKAISVAIKEALDYIKSTNPENFDEKGFTDKIQGVFDKNTKPKEEAKPEPKVEKEEKPKTREKSLFKRAFEGTTDSKMKNLISEHGLDYEIESHDRAQKAAKDFVNEVGPDAALDAVRKNMIEDGAAAFVWAEIIDKVEVELQSATDPDEISRLQEYQRDLLSEFDRKARSGGRFISALQRIYRDSLFNYKADTQIQRYKDMNNGVIPAEIEQKFKDLEARLKEVNEKLKETEAKLEEEREKQAIADIKESVEREAKTKPSVKKAAKRIADKIREGKTNRPDIFMSSSPAAIVWNGALEVAAKSVEAGGSIAEALQKGLEHIRNSDWYKNLSDDTKKSAEKGFRDHINETNPKNTQVEVVGDKIKIPHELIRQKVADGITDPNELAQSVLDEIKVEYPDLTIRQVRDAISKYGRQVNMSKEEIEVKIRKIKRLQKAISQLEDIAQGKRPLRSGLQRDALDAEERAIQKEVKERMKELPADEETAARELKTALDAVKSRLRNAIEDIQREIETRQKSPKKGTIEYDQEAKDLAAERDRLKAVRDEILGPKTLTEEQMIDRAVKGLDRSIREMERQIAEEDVAPKNKTQVTSPEIEERRARKRLLAAQLKTMREELGITQARQLANAKKRAQAQIDELNRRLQDKDFSKKTKKQSPTDQELNDLRAEKVRIQRAYDTEQYKNELKNRAAWQKIIDYAIEIINIPRALRATLEFSPVLIQGGIQTVSHPISAMKAFRVLALNAWSEKRAEAWMDRLVASSEYPVMEQAGLAITKTDAKMTAREELYLSGMLTVAWEKMGLPLKILGKKPYEIWKAANPPAAFERGGTGYLNVLRVERFLQGMRMLEMQGKNPQDNPQEYKALAKVINTLTGRTSLGRAEMMSKVLSIALFSPRNYASVVKQTLLLPLLAEGRNQDGTMKPSVAQKIAMSDWIVYMGVMTSIIAMVKFAYEDDDDPDAPKVETDPRSSQFMTIRTGNTVVDPWHGMKQYVVLASRLISGSTVNGKGEVKELGSGPYVPTEGKLLYNTLFKYKLSPTASMVEKYLSAPRKKDEKGEYVKVDEFSKEPINVLDMTTSNLYPIYWETLMEVNKDRPADVALFLNALAFWGIGTQTYEQQVKKKKKPEYKKVD